MSQHDFEIANQGFPSFRSDLNSGLQALASNSAGATEPSTTYAYQFWYDETTDILKMRNGDDDAWITLAFFDQTNDEWEVRSAVIQAVDSAGVVIKTDEGTTRLTIADDGTVTVANNLAVTGTTTLTDDLNVDSGTLFVDASDNSVGIGTTSSASFKAQTDSRLVVGTGVGTAGAMTLYSGSSSYGSISWADGTSGAEAYAGIIRYSHPLNAMLFYTNGLNERVRIDSSGNLLFNSGFGSVATAYGCRAWVNFNGTGTVAIREDGNVSSITDLATGEYGVNFSSSMPDANYAGHVTAGKVGGPPSSSNSSIGYCAEAGAQISSRYSVVITDSTGTLVDRDWVNVAIFR